jgi:hypothetical protein
VCVTITFQNTSALLVLASVSMLHNLLRGIIQCTWQYVWNLLVLVSCFSGYLLVKQSQRRRQQRPPRPAEEKQESGLLSWKSPLVKTGFFTLGLPAVLAGLSIIGMPVAQVRLQ